MPSDTPAPQTTDGFTRWRLVYYFKNSFGDGTGRCDALLDKPFAWPLSEPEWDWLEGLARQDADRTSGAVTLNFTLYGATPLRELHNAR